jgi:hypothetical protein
MKAVDVVVVVAAAAKSQIEKSSVAVVDNSETKNYTKEVDWHLADWNGLDFVVLLESAMARTTLWRRVEAIAVAEKKPAQPTSTWNWAPNLSLASIWDWHWQALASSCN